LRADDRQGDEAGRKAEAVSEAAAVFSFFVSKHFTTLAAGSIGTVPLASVLLQ